MGIGLLKITEPLPKGYDDCASPALQNRRQQLERFRPNSTSRNCYVFWKKLKLHNRGTPNGKKYKGVSNNLITRKVCDVLVENSYDAF